VPRLGASWRAFRARPIASHVLSAIFNGEQKIDLVDAEIAVGVYRRPL